jgi:hypothetical protein
VGPSRRIARYVHVTHSLSQLTRSSIQRGGHDPVRATLHPHTVNKRVVFLAIERRAGFPDSLQEVVHPFLRAQRQLRRYSGAPAPKYTVQVAGRAVRCGYNLVRRSE